MVVRLEAWESRHVNPEGEIVEVLGRADAPGVDVLSIVRNYHLPTEFPKKVMEEAERARLLARTGEFLRSQPETAHGEFTLPMVTVVLRTQRR